LNEVEIPEDSMHLARVVEIRSAMKPITLILTTAVLSVSAFAAEKSSYQQGLDAVKAGNPEEAKMFFAKALKENPNNAHARVQLDEVTKNSASIAAKGREAKFGKVMLDKVALDKASLEESLELLSTMVTKKTNNEIAPNFILEDPKGSLADRKITLQVTGLPAKAVLQYILDQAGAKARFDEHAIVIQPLR
jgi:hypothetical protein